MLGKANGWYRIGIVLTVLYFICATCYLVYDYSRYPTHNPSISATVNLARSGHKALFFYLSDKPIDTYAVELSVSELRQNVECSKEAEKIILAKKAGIDDGRSLASLVSCRIADTVYVYGVEPLWVNILGVLFGLPAIAWLAIIAFIGMVRWIANGFREGGVNG